jgi:hypothetical protein
VCSCSVLCPAYYCFSVRGRRIKGLTGDLDLAGSSAFNIDMSRVVSTITGDIIDERDCPPARMLRTAAVHGRVEPDPATAASSADCRDGDSDVRKPASGESRKRGRQTFDNNSNIRSGSPPVGSGGRCAQLEDPDDAREAPLLFATVRGATGLLARAASDRMTPGVTGLTTGKQESTAGGQCEVSGTAGSLSVHKVRAKFFFSTSAFR